MTGNELDKLFESIKDLRDSHKEAAGEIRELREFQKETARQFREIQKENAKQNKSLRQELANIGFSNGDFAEEIFFRGFEADPVLGGIRYDTVRRNIKTLNHKSEYDIVLLNGRYVTLIEVKYKLQAGEIDSLIESKTKNFREDFPEYNDHILHFGIGSLVAKHYLKEAAKRKGIYLITQKGDRVEVVNGKVREF